MWLSCIGSGSRSQSTPGAAWTASPGAGGRPADRSGRAGRRRRVSASPALVMTPSAKSVSKCNARTIGPSRCGCVQRLRPSRGLDLVPTRRQGFCQQFRRRASVFMKTMAAIGAALMALAVVTPAAAQDQPPRPDHRDANPDSVSGPRPPPPASATRLPSQEAQERRGRERDRREQPRRRRRRRKKTSPPPRPSSPRPSRPAR